MYFNYKYKTHFQIVFQIQNTNMYFKYLYLKYYAALDTMLQCNNHNMAVLPHCQSAFHMDVFQTRTSPIELCRMHRYQTAAS